MKPVTHSSVVRAAIALLLSLYLMGCSKEAEPAKESKEGLEQALKGVEQAEEGFKRMRERGDTLAQKVDEQTKLLDSTVAKHLGILTGRVNSLEKLVLALPAEKQAAFGPGLAELKQQVHGVEAAFREYRDAPEGKVDESADKLQQLLEKWNAACAQLEAQVREPAAI